MHIFYKKTVNTDMKPHILKISLLIIIGLFFSSNLKAQANELDSLEYLIQTKIHDTTRLEVLYQLAIKYRQEDRTRSIYYTKKLLTFSKKIKDGFHAGIAYNILGMNYVTEDYGLDTIITTFQKGMRQAKLVDNTRLKGMISNSMAITYEKFGQEEKALSLYQQAYTIFNEQGDKGSAIRCLGNIALVLKKDGDLENAKSYYLKAMKIGAEINDTVVVSQLGSNLANIYAQQNKIDSALVLYKRALEVNRAVDDKYFLALSLANIGSVYNKKKQYEIAYSYLEESYQVASKIKDSYCVGTALAYLCDNYYQQKQYNQTISKAKEALTILGENGEMLIRSKFYKYLSDSYEAQGNYKMAFANQQLYHTFSDSLYNTEKSNQINNLKIQYEVNQQETENQLLKSQQEGTKRTIRNREYLAGGLIAALILTIGWGTASYHSNQLKKKNNAELTAIVAERTTDLQTANGNLAVINQELEQANYELRTFNYIASHDIKEPIRVISGYSSLIFKKLPSDLKENLGGYFDTIKQSTSQLYTLAEDFASYTSMSKNETIELNKVDLHQLTYNVIADLQESIQKYNGQVLTAELPTIQSSNSLLFTTLKNLIENGLKYNKSDEPTVEINYYKTKTHHEIIVSDNGIGINKQYHTQVFEMFKRLHNRGAYGGSGIGLAIVKLSIAKLGGNIGLESEEGKGSQFIIHLPL
jgi:signal transduction histidine kinase